MQNTQSQTAPCKKGVIPDIWQHHSPSQSLISKAFLRLTSCFLFFTPFQTLMWVQISQDHISSWNTQISPSGTNIHAMWSHREALKLLAWICMFSYVFHDKEDFDLFDPEITPTTMFWASLCTAIALEAPWHVALNYMAELKLDARALIKLLKSN